MQTILQRILAMLPVMAVVALIVFLLIHLAPGDPAGQTRFVIDKIGRAIAQLGGSLEDVVRTRVFVTDIAHWEPVARAPGERCGPIRPVHTPVGAPLAGAVC